MAKEDYKGILIVPIKVIPEQMSIEQFCEGIKNNDKIVMEIAEKQCYYIATK